MLAQRGIDVSYETVRCWTLKFGPSIAANLRRRKLPPSPRWHLDEMVSTIGGERSPSRRTALFLTGGRERDFDDRSRAANPGKTMSYEHRALSAIAVAVDAVYSGVLERLGVLAFD